MTLLQHHILALALTAVTTFGLGLLVFLADPQQLKQVFLNLVLNSLQAMNGVGRLEIGTVSDGSELTVTIADNGAGISPKDLPRIFEPFFTTKSTGTGLGLAMVQGIVREHKGWIRIESQPERGTTVVLSFPSAR